MGCALQCSAASEGVLNGAKRDYAISARARAPPRSAASLPSAPSSFFKPASPDSGENEKQCSDKRSPQEYSSVVAPMKTGAMLENGIKPPLKSLQGDTGGRGPGLGWL